LPSGVEILATGTATWMLDTTKHQVQRLDPKSLDPLGAAVPVEGVTRAVVDDEGFLWAAVPSQGVVLRVGDGAVGRTEVGRAGENLTVATDAAGEHVIAVNTTAGSTFSLHGAGEARSFTPLPAGSGPAGLHVAVDHDGRVLVGLDGRAVVVPAHGEGEAGSLPEGTKVDQVEIVAGTGYVVDRDSGRLVKVDLASGAGAAVPNVGGDDLDDVEAHGNLLYLNDSGGNQVKVVKPDGVIVPIEKYRPGQKPAKPSVKTPPTSSPSTSRPNRDPQKGQGGQKPKKKKTSNPGDPSPGPKTPSGKPSNPASPDPGNTAGPTTSPTTSPSPDPTTSPTPSPTPDPDGPPEAPVIKALTAEDSRALVEWSEAADRGSAVTGYSIVIDNGLVLGAGADATSVELTGLTNGQKYGVQVRALSAAGEGDLSKIRYVTPSADLPGTPGGVTAEARDAEIRVTWNAAAAGPRSPVSGYTVTAISPNGTRKSQEVTGLQGSVTGLTNGTGYLVEVSARSTGGVGEPGKPAAGQPGSTEAPAVPSGKPGQVAVQAPKNGNGSAVITWSAAPDAGSAITGYEVQVGTGAVKQAGTKLTYPATGLTNDVDTTVQVRAVNKNGQGPWTSVKAHPVVPRKTIYQCKSLQVADIWMLNLTTNCNNATATRWNPATTIFKAPSSQQTGTVQLFRCERSTARGIIRQQLQGCPSGSETDNVSFWAWTSQHAGATQIVEWHYASEGNQGGYYYAPSTQGAPSGFSKTGRSFWV
jgi:hypothetical protein